MKVALLLRKILLVLLLAFGSHTMVKAQACLDSQYAAHATYYTVQSSGNCSFPMPASPIYTAAMGPAFYDTAATCGACLQVLSNKGSVIVSVEDQCPGCVGADLDLSMDVDTILDSVAGITSIKWKFVGCPVVGPANIYISSASNLYYIQLQIRNHRYPVRSVLFRSSNTTGYIVLPRAQDNFFNRTGGSGPDSLFDLKIIDILGDTITQTGIVLNNDTIIPASAQFPECTSTAIDELVNDSHAISVRNNPSANGQFFLLNKNSIDVDYKIADFLGREVSSGKIPAHAETQVMLQAKGLYLLYDTNVKGRSVAQKLIVD